MLAFTLTGNYLHVGLAVIPLVLLARLVAVVAALAALGPWGQVGPATRQLLTWGGLRGGISSALAMVILGVGLTALLAYRVCPPVVAAAVSGVGAAVMAAIGQVTGGLRKGGWLPAR